MKEFCGQFLTVGLLVLAGVSSTQALDLEADMCINGQHPEKCCYETYCPANGDGSFLPTNMTGKIYDSISFTKVAFLYFLSRLLQCRLLPGVVPVLSGLQFLPRLRGAAGLEPGGQEVLPALGGGGVRGEHHHLHLHHQEEHLHPAQGVRGGRLL